MTKHNTYSHFVWNSTIIGRAIVDAFRKLNPRIQMKNPVMFVVEVGSAIATAYLVVGFLREKASLMFELQITIWLWFTVLFANFAEAMAEGRGKSQAESLRRASSETIAHRVSYAGWIRDVPNSALRSGDVIVVDSGERIPGDGQVIEGTGLVNEDAITGESAPVVRAAGTDHCSVIGGTKLVSDRLKVRITSNPGDTFLDRMVRLVEGAQRQKTPNEIALDVLLAGLTILFIFAVGTLNAFSVYSAAPINVFTMLGLLVCLIPTTIGGLLSAIGIAGMDRLVQHNIVAMSGRAIEAAGDVSTLLLDKTGTITVGNRQATRLAAVADVDEQELAHSAYLSSLADETAEGRSIVALAQKQYGLHDGLIGGLRPQLIPFTAATRMSGIDLNGTQIRKGAADAIFAHVRGNAGEIPEDACRMVREVAEAGATPLVVAKNQFILGVIELKDVLKPRLVERLKRLRAMGIRSIMITGDNSLTAATIAREAGLDDYLAEARPEDKVGVIRREQEEGKLVAMTGDGTNDAPALAQADVGLVMNNGTQEAKEAGNMVDLDSDPTKLIEVVEIGKQLLITRGALTTFSVANDVAKYFAILPAMFAGTFPVLDQLNIMRLHTPHSAILSAVIFNALIIILLIPLALRGVKYRPVSASRQLLRNLMIYGVGGIIAPFALIKIIDEAVTALHLV